MPEPGWYDDPEDATQLRWWDGERWTDRRQPREDVAPPPPPPPAPPPPAGGAHGIPIEAGDGGPGAGTSDIGSGWGETPGTGFAAVGTGAAPPRTFVEAAQVCLTKYVDGKGRASRSEYWYFILFAIAALSLLFLVLVTLGMPFEVLGPDFDADELEDSQLALVILLLIAFLALIPPFVAVIVRRLHDVGLSGWFTLLVFLLAPLFYISYIVVGVLPPTQGPNRYG